VSARCFCSLVLVLVSSTWWHAEGSTINGVECTETPNGRLPSHCVKEIPSGSEVITEEKHLRIIHPSGDEELFPRCDDNLPEASRWVEDGWIAYAQGPGNGADITSFTASWVVPEDPVGFRSGPTDFFFTGLLPLGVAIIQPVLQWGRSLAGGIGWGIASWYVVGSTAVYSTLLNIKAGNTINGTMEMSNEGSWYIGISVEGSSPTYLIQTGLGGMEQACVTLDAYNVVECDDYPGNGAITFTNLQFKCGGQPCDATLYVTISHTDCNQAVDASSSEVTITWSSSNE